MHFFDKFVLKPDRQDLKSCQLIAFDKSNVQRIAHFLPKSDFHVVAIFILLEVGYLVTIVMYFVYKWARQLFSEHYKITSAWFMFSEFFSDWWFNFVTVTKLYYFFKVGHKSNSYQILKIRNGGKVCQF